MKNIRNFSIIAHIDHGKSTLSDQFIKKCKALPKREMSSQVLDTMELEKERGITIKAQSVTIKYIYKKKTEFFLNFIDTPGHVDFSYEVSRSLSACEGALLLIDAAQGIEAQTVANCKTALEMNLKVLPVINKIDLPTAKPEKIKKEIKEIIGISTKELVFCSAKTGFGISALLDNIVKHIPAPIIKINCPLKALIIDSWFNSYVGVIALIRIKQGLLKKNDEVITIETKKIFKIEKIGIFTPKKKEVNALYSGEVGWIICGIKDIDFILVGDTITKKKNPTHNPLPGFKKIKPQVYSGLFPVDPSQYKYFQDSLKKLSLNDSSLFYEVENSEAIGFGFRCGFLGLLHMEIIHSRLEREYNLDIISTPPSVIYEILLKNKKKIFLDSPSQFSSLSNIKEIREPIAICKIFSPFHCIGKIIKLCIQKRGKQIDLIYHSRQVLIIYEIPLSEIILNFFDKIKSVSNGYASFEYEFKKFKKSEISCLEILINTSKIDALSLMIHNKNIKRKAREIVEKIKKFIPRHQFDIIIQAVVKNRIIAKSNIKQLRKNVLSKCYGGDISRKKKLLQKQKEGKKRMKKIGNINIPKETFLEIVKNN